MPLVESPFAVLTVVVAPAILTNACSVLSLGTANRVARVVDRKRAVNASLAATDLGPEDRTYLLRQMERLDLRGQLLVRALRLFYFALGAFASSVLVAIVGSILTAWNLELGFYVAAALGIVIGSAAVIGLATGCAMMVRETKLAIDNMVDSVHPHEGHGNPESSFP